jgi:prepilin-type N-terminal cleavage/methylation domain-containing protein
MRRFIHSRICASGFTLVELLVVISILGLLAGLSIPAIAKAQMSARTSASMANLKQIHVLMQTYLAENNGVYPRPVYWSGENAGVWPDQDAGVYWRRLIWNAAYPSSLFWDPKFGEGEAKGGSYTKVMWCPVMTLKHGFVNYAEGHGSYAMNTYFSCWDGSPLRRASALAGMGRQEPYIMTGTLNPAQPQVGTGPYVESSRFPYNTPDQWYNLAYAYGAGTNKALGLFIDGRIELLDKDKGIQLHPLLNNADDFQ